MDNLLICLRSSITPEMYTDIEKYIKRLEAENKEYRETYLDTRKALYNSDITVHNQKKALEIARERLEGYEVENKHLRGLLKIWL